MTVPVREATATSSTAFSDTVVVDLPAGIAAGDVLTIQIALFAGRTCTTPTGWTKLFGTGEVRHHAYAKIAAGDEGASVSFTLSSATGASHTAARYSSAHGDFEGAQTADVADPPNLAPAWGTDDVLWELGLAYLDTTPPATVPANYGNIVTAPASIDMVMSICYRTTNAASENAGAWTNFDTARGASIIAIRGAAAGASAVCSPLGRSVIQSSRNGLGRVILPAMALAIPTLHQVLHFSKTVI